jgi:hypothetical protein
MVALQRLATSAAMYKTLRTSVRPPVIARRPRMVPELRLTGATAATSSFQLAEVAVTRALFGTSFGGPTRCGQGRS